MLLLRALAVLLLLCATRGAVLGIDVGASSYKVAVIRGGGLDVLLNDVSKRKTATAIAFHPEEGVFHGDVALNYALRAPDRAVTSVMLHLGRQGPHAPPLQSNERGTAELRLAPEGESIAVEALASMLLAKVRAHGGNVRDVALSVPAWFGHTQRRALLDAAELAGLSVLSLVNDGAALAVAYATLRGTETAKAAGEASEGEHVLLIDVGAWSSRATLLSVRVTEVAAASKGGKSRLVPLVSVLHHAWEENAGGDAIDALLAAHLQRQVPHPLSDRARLRLLREAKRVKEVLSANSHTIAQVEGLVEEWNLRVTVTRKELEALLDPLLPRIVAPIHRVLAAANLSAASLAAAEVVGGGGRVPAVAVAQSEALGGRALDRHLNGDEALVEGAALYAASLSTGLRVREVRLRDGSPFAYTVRLSIQPEPEEGLAEAQGAEAYEVVLFKKGAKVGGRKTLKVRASEPFTVSVAHADPSELTRGVPAHVVDYAVGGFEALQGLGPARVVLQFRLSSSGLVELERVHAEVIESVPDAPATEQESKNTAEEGAKEPPATGEDEGGKQTGEPEAASGAAAADDSKKQRVRHVLLKTSATLPAVQMNDAQRKEAEAVLGRLKAREEARKKREAAKNALEAEVYALRERLEESATQACSSEVERDILASALTENGAWLDDSGATASTEQYVARERALKSLYAPIARRIAEEESRPRAVEGARTVLEKLPGMLLNMSAYLNVTDEEIRDVLAELTDTLKWLDDVTAQQQSRARHEDPAFASDEVNERVRRIDKKTRRLLSRPARPPPAAPAAPTADTAAADTAAAAAAEQEAIKEEKEKVPEN